MVGSGLKKDAYHVLLNTSAKLLGARRTKELEARFRFGRKLNLDDPKTLADKVSWMELYTDQALAARYTDKYEVRSYVKDKGLEGTLIPLCGGPWESVDDIDLSSLPNQFVLKATHGCAMNFICKDKSSVDARRMLRDARAWLSSDYGRACIEPHYKAIPHRLYAECYIGGMGDVVDYKFHCIHGKPRFVLVCSNREESLNRDLYDLEWNPIEGLKKARGAGLGMPRPHCLLEMIEVARCLSADFDFVRVDLYEREHKVLFGELTFSPSAGVFPHFTDEFVACWGEQLVLGR